MCAVRAAHATCRCPPWQMAVRCTFPACGVDAVVFITSTLGRCELHAKVCNDLHQYANDCGVPTRRFASLATHDEVSACVRTIGAVERCIKQVEAMVESGCLAADPDKEKGVKRKASQKRAELKKMRQSLSRYMTENEPQVMLLVVIVMSLFAVAIMHQVR